MIYVQFIKNTFVSIVFVFCVSGIVLLGGQWLLQEYFNDISSSLTISNSHYAEKNKKIKEVNRLIYEIDALQQVRNPWRSIVVEFGNAIPEGITINGLSLNSDTITFSGKADTRDALLKMQTDLNGLDFIDNIIIPISQLTEKEDFTFSISATAKF